MTHFRSHGDLQGAPPRCEIAPDADACGDEHPSHRSWLNLEQRRTGLAEQRASYERAPRHDYDLGARLAIERILAHMETERVWLTQAIALLRETPAP